jgi:energy-converting hydrogenase B subunit Q
MNSPSLDEDYNVVSPFRKPAVIGTRTRHLFATRKLDDLPITDTMPVMPVDMPEILRERYSWMKAHTAEEEASGYAIEVLARDRLGLLADISGEVASLGGDMWFVQSWIEHDGASHILIQVREENPKGDLIQAISSVASVTQVSVRPTYGSTYGKRVIVIGGGAQVASVASGAIAEADRHNIRGEGISVDTMAVIGEEKIASVVRAVGRLHRAGILVLAGALMGGAITQAVHDLRHVYGIPVIALKMAGSVTDEVDLVVTDPLEAGVMSVMLISHIGQFDLLKIHGKEF